VPTPAPTPPCYGSSAVLPPSECIAWTEFFDATGGPQWAVCSHTRLNPCGCYGGVQVECDGGHISNLQLNGNNLIGNIPRASLGKLVGLTQLILRDNNISGSIPSELSRLEYLRELDLSNNQIQGSIPASLAGMAELTYLLLGGNRLTGTVPPLPFGQYRSCCLQRSGTSDDDVADDDVTSSGDVTGNSYECPLPPNISRCHLLRHRCLPPSSCWSHAPTPARAPSPGSPTPAPHGGGGGTAGPGSGARRTRLLVEVSAGSAVVLTAALVFGCRWWKSRRGDQGGGGGGGVSGGGKGKGQGRKMRSPLLTGGEVDGDERPSILSRLSGLGTRKG
jgi:hypothetical protein